MSRRLRTSFLPIILISIALFSTPVDVLYGDWSDPGSSSGGGVSDHGGLTGLTDDDHTQYLERDGSDTFAGDLVADSDSSRSLGSTLVRWLNGWFDAITIGGNITVGGTVDGRDVAADGTTLDGIDTEAERYHNTSHAENAGDELLIENLGTACADGYVAVSDGAGGLDCEAQSGSGGGPGPADIDWDLGAMIPAGEDSGLPSNIDGLSGNASDPTTAPIKLMVFPDSEDTGAHRATRVTTDAASFQVVVEGRASSAASGSVRVCVAWLPFSSYIWQTAVCNGWTAPGNDDDSVSVTLSGSLATWGMAQDEVGLLLLYRDGDGTSGTDDYAADWYGRHLQGRWSP